MASCESTEVCQIWISSLRTTPDGLSGLGKDSATLFLMACRMDCIYLSQKVNLPLYFAEERILTTRCVVREAASE